MKKTCHTDQVNAFILRLELCYTNEVLMALVYIVSYWNEIFQMISPLDKMQLPGPYGEWPTLVLTADDGAASRPEQGHEVVLASWHSRWVERLWSPPLTSTHPNE